jgi:hypothetical protein
MCEQCKTLRLKIAKGEGFARSVLDEVTTPRLREYIENLKAEILALEASDGHVR